MTRFKNFHFRSLPWTFWCGLSLVLAYWLMVHPPGFQRGYFEDFCNENSLNVMAHNLQEFGLPRFTTDRFMAPYGMGVPFFSWSIERDWIGSYVWLWNKEFPFLWVYLGVSLLASFAVLGKLISRMGFTRTLAWGLAAFFVLFHVPRHFKLWKHYEYLTQHWVYWSLILDAWIWQRFVRERKISVSLECWRAVCLVGVLGTAGYFWGPMYLEWAIVRLTMVGMLFFGGRREIEWNPRKCIAPVLVGLGLSTIVLLWFIPLLTEVLKLGNVPQVPGYFVQLSYLIRPLWFDVFFSPFLKITPFFAPESVVTIGWVYWIPALLGFWWIRKRKGGPGIQVILPFVILLAIALGYILIAGYPPYFQLFIQALMPPMKFFRVSARWGQLLPEIFAALILLSWPELMRWFKPFSKRFPKTVWVFAALSAVEVTTLFHPVEGLPPLDKSVVGLLDRLEKAPGTTVLDLPFCTSGGNGVCSAAQCPNYPYSNIGQCFASWHGKKVHGLYQARLVPSQCQIYNHEPYTEWFRAWRQDRCFRPAEWQDFCTYLDAHPEFSAVLLYPDFWTGAGAPECLNEFENHLGPPVDEAHFEIYQKNRRLLRYRPSCTRDK